MNNRLQDIQGFLRTMLRASIQAGDIALDLTAGRGRDTLFLAQLVGAEGRVHAFDVQEVALQETQRLLKEQQMAERVCLYHWDHGRLLEKVQDPVQAAMFNLGYLPGHSQKITTQAASTLAALEAVLQLLRQGGVIALTVYRGHPGGLEEAAAVEEFLSCLPRRKYSVLRGEYINQLPNAPYWILVQKNKGDTE
ncbi:class I SAM-dependent methyltransferase [Desulfitobacterium chlororespirans]|uniref:Putative rRNA methylase n=1 Tax=Desulfitobacterium chlororespirans DSM 11544 TaxID=1121395 RepID=A0A1M7U686_9FIRM|nr:class I SAM-dependent methyltransferase [Desulfitobacterium chlororespirans]SHN78407.1 Putative rRNA methylase [Desulfitobacterium chlororespirans DSM 11544]